MSAEEELELVYGLIAECYEYELDGRIVLKNFTSDELVAIYNGTGPEWMSEKARKVLDTLSKDLLPAVLIHDVEFHIGGSRTNFYFVNERLRHNCIVLAKSKYGWWRPRRYRLLAQANLFADLCQACGKLAYNGDKK